MRARRKRRDGAATPRYRGRVAAAVARDAWDALKIYSIYRTHRAADSWKPNRLAIATIQLAHLDARARAAFIFGDPENLVICGYGESRRNIENESERKKKEREKLLV